MSESRSTQARLDIIQAWWDKNIYESRNENLSLVPNFNEANTPEGVSAEYTNDNYWRCYDCKRKHPPVHAYCAYCTDNWLGER